MIEFERRKNHFLLSPLSLSSGRHRVSRHLMLIALAERPPICVDLEASLPACLPAAVLRASKTCRRRFRCTLTSGGQEEEEEEEEAEEE